jgi:4-hydroxy-2-oxoheptanedioate aldolase
MSAILKICKAHGVACGRPRVDARNAQRAIDEGYRFLMAPPVRSFAALEACRTIAGRE